MRYADHCPRFVHLLLVQAERAWALAMHIKSTHAADNASKGISGSTRKHILAKLHKAASHARHLVTLLSDRTTTKATDHDYLEAEAYALYLTGSEAFEQQAHEHTVILQPLSRFAKLEPVVKLSDRVPGCSARDHHSRRPRCELQLHIHTWQYRLAHEPRAAVGDQQ